MTTTSTVRVAAASLSRRGADIIARCGPHEHAWWPASDPRPDLDEVRDYIDGAAADQLDRIHNTESAGSGGPSAMTFHRAGSDRTANHQDDSKETPHV